MARVQRANGSVSWLLPARCLLGRSRVCAVRLDDLEVSGEHALFRWTGGAWELQDLHSRNGTFVDGRPVGAGQRVELARGCVLGFGRPDGYLLSDDDPPRPFAVHVGLGREVEGQGGLLALPGPGRAEVMIQRVRDGWALTAGSEVRPVEDGEVVQTTAGPWLLRLPDPLTQTCEFEPAAPTIASLSLHFRVSRDEEYVELVAQHGVRVFDLKARAHHYPLLLLARARLADRELPAERQGWIQQDELLRQLGSDSSRLHIDIFRCRRQLAEIGIVDAAQLVERRAGTRQLRIGVSRLEISTLGRGRVADAS